MLVKPADNIPTSNATSTEWIVWYKALDYYFNRQETNYLFLAAWQKRGNSDANDSKLRAFAKSKGIDIDSDLSDFEFLTNPFGLVDWFRTSANWAFVAIGIGVFLAFLIAYRLSKNVKLDIPIV
jgi:hypothetical protein